MAARPQGAAASGVLAARPDGRPSGRFGYHRGVSQAAEIERPGASLTRFTAKEASRLVARVTPVDAVGITERAASLAKRSIKRESKLWALDLAIRSMDLTTLEGVDTPGKIVAMCAKAVRPDPLDASIPSVAAVCLYPQLVPVAVEHLRRTDVKVASVAGGFPSGLGPLDVRLGEIRDVAAMGADEIDIVLNRSLFLGGRYAACFEELVAAREAAGTAHLKVILETGELGSFDRVRQASVLAMAAGADFIKTSTGKISTGAELSTALCMMEAIRDFSRETGQRVGLKVAGGIRQSKNAIQYLTVLYETLGPEWMTPDRFRIGASTLLNDALMQIAKERTGRYQSPDHFTID
jgi:deoxyribose-phosphate aldolase